MKPIKFNKTPVYKTYDNLARVEVISQIVDRDESNYKSNAEYVKFCDYVHADPRFRSQNHYLRYMNTAGVLFSKLVAMNSLKVVETGGASPLSAFLSLENECFHTETDLRTEIDVPDAFADLIICCEVFEHIKDHEPSNFNELTSFQSSGAKKFIEELLRTLKVGGRLLLTTPNPCSYRAILNAVQHKPSYIFRGHVREYTKNELLELFAEFELLHYETQNNFSLVSGDGVKLVQEKFEKLNWSIKDRGDNHVFLFTKKD